MEPTEQESLIVCNLVASGMSLKEARKAAKTKAKAPVKAEAPAKDAKAKGPVAPWSGKPPEGTGDGDDA